MSKTRWLITISRTGIARYAAAGLLFVALVAVGFRSTIRRYVPEVQNMSFTASVLDRFQDSYKPLTPAGVHKLEEFVGAGLPNDYVEFLRKHNGGCFHHGVGIKSSKSHTGIFRVGEMYGLVYDEWEIGSDVRENYDRYQKWPQNPPDRLPIGDWSGIGIYLEFRGPNSGHVWCKETYQSNGDLVASSFTEFLERLQPDDEAETLMEAIPIFQAVERGDLETVRKFIDDGQNVDYRDANGRTLIMCSAKKCWPKIVQLLLERGADANACDSRGNTPLHYACEGRSFDGVATLLDAGSNPNAENTNGKSVLQAAKEAGAWRAARFLVARGAVGQWQKD
jgi:hypothetical protein